MGVEFTVYQGVGIVIPAGVAEAFVRQHDATDSYGVEEYLEDVWRPAGVDIVTVGSYYDSGEDNRRILAITGRYNAYGSYDAPGGLWSDPKGATVNEPTEEQIKAVKSAAKVLGIKKEDRKVVPFIGGLWH